MPSMRVSTTNGFLKVTARLESLKNKKFDAVMRRYGDEGVRALASATPVESGQTARSWTYKIENSPTGLTIKWVNTHIVNGFPVAVALNFGHGTGTGGWVQGRHYITPAIEPVMNKIAEGIRRELRNG